MEILATQADYLQLIYRAYVDANSEQKSTVPFKHYLRPDALKAPEAPVETINLSGLADLLKEKL